MRSLVAVESSVFALFAFVSAVFSASCAAFSVFAPPAPSASADATLLIACNRASLVCSELASAVFTLFWAVAKSFAFGTLDVIKESSKVSAEARSLFAPVRSVVYSLAVT